MDKDSYDLFLDWYRNELIRWIDIYTDPETPDAHRDIMVKGFGLSRMLNTISHSENGLLARTNGDLDRIAREVAEEYSGYKAPF